MPTKTPLSPAHHSCDLTINHSCDRGGVDGDGNFRGDSGCVVDGAEASDGGWDVGVGVLFGASTLPPRPWSAQRRTPGRARPAGWQRSQRLQAAGAS